MIRERYKAIECNICDKTLAIKRVISYQVNEPYVTLRDCRYHGQKQIHLCADCFSRLKYKIINELAERSKGK